MDSFTLFESVGLFGGGKPPYDYVEIIDVNDMDAFGRDVATEEMARIAGEFQGWADPVFILTRQVHTP